MIIQNEPNYTLRNDGKSFKAIQYNFSGKYERALELAEWLHEHTNNSTTKKIIYELIAAYAKRLPIKDLSSSDTMLQHLHSLSTRCTSPGFIENIATDIDAAEIYDIDDLCNSLMIEYCQEFCELLRTASELVFYISSNDFDWFDLIYDVVDRCKNSRLSVSILRANLEDRDQPMFLYKNDQVCDNIPIKEFLESFSQSINESIIDKSAMKTAYSRFNGKAGYHNMNSQWLARYNQYTVENFEE